MTGVISSLGSGIGINILSDALIKKLTAFKDQKAVQRLFDALHEWETQFEQKHDGTIVTKGAFYAYIKHYHVLENILEYVLSPSDVGPSEDIFLNDLCSKITEYLSTAFAW